MMDKLNQSMMAKIAQSINPADHPLFQSLSTIIANIEHEQAQALAGACETADMDIEIRHSAEARQEQLIDVADAITSDELAEWWFSEMVDVEKPEQITRYCGLDGEQWRQQLRDWYRKYHEAGVVDKPLAAAAPEDIGHIGSMHIQNSYGIGLDEFVAGVVNWSKGSALETLLAGQMRQHTQLIHSLAAHIEEQNKRIEELEG